MNTLNNPQRKTSSSNNIIKLKKEISPTISPFSIQPKDNNINLLNLLDSSSPISTPLNNNRRDKKSLTTTNNTSKVLINKEKEKEKNKSQHWFRKNTYLNTNDNLSTLNFRNKSVNIFKQNFKSCNKNLPVVKTRKDSYGLLIKKGSKNHHIIFKDKINEEYDLAEVIDVESYKKFNLQDDEYSSSDDSDYDEERKDDSSSVCSVA